MMMTPITTKAIILFLSKMISFIGGHVYDVWGRSRPDERGGISICASIQASCLLGHQIPGWLHKYIVNRWDKIGKSVLYTAISHVDKIGQMREIFS